MLYKEIPVFPELTSYVQLVWMMESETKEDIFPKEQIMPDGILEFVTHVKDPWMTTVHGEESKVQPKSFMISQMKKSIEIESKGETGLVSVRFFPWGAYHFFDYPVNSFVDDTISAKELWPDHYDKFINGFNNEDHWEGKVNLVQEFLLERLKENKKNNKALDDAVKLIRQSKGQLSIADVTMHVNLSKKQLERYFLPALGTTPKTFARISRFLNICHSLEEHKNKTLTELSYECGYFDQAHFIKEFSEFSGYTPKEYFARNNVGFADL